MLARVKSDPHKTAAVTYGGLGVLVILITFLADLVPQSQEDALVGLFIGAIFIVLFAALLFWRGWWLLSAVLMFSNSWRALTYFNDARGVHLELLPLSVTSIDPSPVAFVNALLMIIIVVMLARSTWFGIKGWRTIIRN